ncbi:MAG TPA: TonB family protein [Prolixibacteraceae bacterium]|nr:TonB family protein [Prolixibacteraceae bacterium]
MKTKVVFLLCMILTVVAFGQSERHTTLSEIEVIPPKFPAVETTWNGKNIESINDYLNNHVVYPDEAINNGYQGTEVVQFIVTPTGELTNMNIINSVCHEIDREVIRVLTATSGQWKSASIDGQPSAMIHEVSVVFKCNDNNDFMLMAKNYFLKGNKLLALKKDPKKALKYYDMGIMLTPNEESLLVARAICKYELGDVDGAVRDWNRMMTLDNTGNNDFKTTPLPHDLSNFKGYVELIQLTKK